MGEPNNSVLHQEINQNMSVVSRGGFQANNEELAFQENKKNAWSNSRALRKKPVNKLEQQKNTQEWVNTSGRETMIAVQGNENKMQVTQRSARETMIDVQGNAHATRVTQQYEENTNANLVVQQNNKSSSEDIDTIRENIRNSKESLKKNSCENILTIEENMRAARKTPSTRSQIPTANKRREPTSTDVTQDNQRNSRELKTKTQTGREPANISNHNQRNIHELRTNTNTRYESIDTVQGSVDELKQSPRSPSGKDAYSDAIDLSNNCRQFYFTHLKASEAIKQSVRSAKHNQARDKMEGKKCSSLDNAMGRLRAEMADLMDQDLSLMSQLLKLNDKIEEVKHQVSLRQRSDSIGGSSSYMSSGEMSDSEYSDFDDSKLDMSLDYRSSFDCRTSSATFFNANDASKVEPVAPNAEPKSHETKSNEVVLRKVEPSERDIIVYKKIVRKPKYKKKVSSKTDEDDDTEGETADDESDDSVTEDGGSQSADTESTISCNSCSTDSISDAVDEDDNADSGIQSPVVVKKPPVVPPKPRKGGVSHNTNFMDFHKCGDTQLLSGLNPVLTLQGHHISVEKYYVPQGLVYLKHTQSENVFCQFSH